MRLDGLGIKAGEKRIDGAMNLNVLDPILLEDAGKDAAPGAVQRVNSKLELGRADLGDIHKLQHGLDVGRLEICFLYFRFVADRVRIGAKLGFNRLHDGWRGGPAVAGLVLQTIPIPWIMAGGDDDTAHGIEMFNSEGNAGSRDVVVRKRHRDTAAGDGFCDDLGSGA